MKECQFGRKRRFSRREVTRWLRLVAFLFESGLGGFSEHQEEVRHLRLVALISLLVSDTSGRAVALLGRKDDVLTV